MKPYKRKEAIGNCTLYLGDCFNILPIIKNVESIITDPPYGMNYVSNHRKIKYDSINNDDTQKLAIDIINWSISNIQYSSYIFGRWDNIYEYPKPKSLITWVKNNWSAGDLIHEHARQAEVIFYYPGLKYIWGDNCRPSDVVFSDRTNNEFHPTEKPIDLMKRIIKWAYGNIIDPFMGSGTTGVACLQLNRKFIGIEIDEKYFDIACNRIASANLEPWKYNKSKLNLFEGFK
jgi:site-specific DNA-methyltransferase (adenine-specific)